MSNIHNFLQAHSIKGFLCHEEGTALYQYAKLAASVGPVLEIGSYCGKSSVYLGTACKEADGVLYSVDHHRGSEEHQYGEEYHDEALYDAANQCMNSFPEFRKTLMLAGLEQSVVPMVTASETLVKHWSGILGMVFVDGGHSPEMSMADCVSWAEHIAVGGFLAIHDIFESPENGGQGPYLGMKAVLDSGRYQLQDRVMSLAILKRVS
ncbi:class I SAM-dependent methyltransferase [Teredinibacter sp. KSP-S5-2]|uniref:class I SAM-dependent methyltransferase n=1 Tax=Teredinibacter sp. KSP-S5-2 TaxID=3034506 RepID=UPI002934D691|nr:class I SAM-dependent methyltransferase [Teredinibacter sp. KSP-S5-2]WNO11745.1 class I SAM-dependent methyltransferase [Teredinibacter sp. KSP-S5-2]